MRKRGSKLQPFVASTNSSVFRRVDMMNCSENGVEMGL